MKHLVRIEPITYPFGEPEAKDINHTYLKDNGECVVVKEIGNNNLRKRTKIRYPEKVLDQDTLERDSRMKWLNPWA